LAADRKDIDAL